MGVRRHFVLPGKLNVERSLPLLPVASPTAMAPHLFIAQFLKRFVACMAEIRSRIAELEYIGV